MSQDPPARPQPVCELCHSDEYLVYEHVRAVKKPRNNAPSLWDVDCWCGNCETFYGFTTAHLPRDPRGVQAFP